MTDWTMSGFGEDVWCYWYKDMLMAKFYITRNYVAFTDEALKHPEAFKKGVE